MSHKESHGKLTKSRDQLLAQQSKNKVLPSSSTSIVISPRNSCAMTNIVGGEKTLHDVINSERVNNGKEGLGFVAKSKKKNNKEKKKKKATSLSQNITFVKETNTIEVAETSRKSTTQNDFAKKINPSYVLMRSRNGYVYAKYVRTTYGDDYH